MLRSLDTGRADRLFSDQETKLAFIEELDTKLKLLIGDELEADPETYKRHPDGTWSLASFANVVPFKRR